jgi:hypothetical protein
VPQRVVPPLATPGALGPRTFGDLFGETFRVYRAGFLAIIIIVAVTQLPLALLGFWVGSAVQSAMLEVFGPLDQSQLPGLESGSEVDSDQVLNGFWQVFRLAAWPIMLLVIANWLASILMTGALIHAVSRHLTGRAMVVSEAYAFSLSHLGRMLGASAIVLLVVVPLAASFIGIPVAAYLGVRWYFSLQSASLERRSPLQALSRSSSLVRDNWWRTFGILLVFWVLVAVGSAVGSAVLGLVPYVGAIVVSILFAPIVGIAQTLQYHDLRVRRDTAAVYTPQALERELERPQSVV